MRNVSTLALKFTIYKIKYHFAYDKIMYPEQIYLHFIIQSVLNGKLLLSMSWLRSWFCNSTVSWCPAHLRYDYEKENIVHLKLFKMYYCNND